MLTRKSINKTLKRVERRINSHIVNILTQEVIKKHNFQVLHLSKMLILAHAYDITSMAYQIAETIFDQKEEFAWFFEEFGKHEEVLDNAFKNNKEIAMHFVRTYDYSNNNDFISHKLAKHIDKSLEVFKLAIDTGSNIYAKNSKGISVIGRVIEKNRNIDSTIEALQHMVANGYDVNTLDKMYKFAPNNTTVYNRNIIPNCIFINTNPMGYVVMREYAPAGYCDTCIRYLASVGCDPNATIDNNNLLVLSIRNRYDHTHERVKALLECGANPNITPDTNYYIALEVIVSYDATIAQMLCDHGMTINLLHKPEGYNVDIDSLLNSQYRANKRAIYDIFFNMIR